MTSWHFTGVIVGTILVGTRLVFNTYCYVFGLNSSLFTLFLLSLYTAFHLASPVHDLDIAKDFYGNVLGCAEGRSSEKVMKYCSDLKVQGLCILFPIMSSIP